MLFTIDDITRATGGRKTGSGAEMVTGVSTDSRTVAAGQLFVPLLGERFDGHGFITSAAERGVRVFLVGESWLAENTPPAGTVCIAVTDTLTALGDLASFHRNRFNIPVVGITGSNGKTTTKEMLATILSATGPGLKTRGNLNNLIGLPLMLLELTAEHRWAVLEMGMSEPGEIDRLAAMARPEVGVITNALPAHLASMGSVENVARAKGELFLRLPATGTAVYNADDTLVSRLPMAEGARRLSFGFNGAQVTATSCRTKGKAGQSFLLTVGQESLPVDLPAFGRHMIANALAAAAAAHALHVPLRTVVAGLGRFQPVDKRFTLENVGGITLIDDSYNANPASMAAALVTLGEIKESSRAVAVLGDMLEMGEGSPEAHRNVGRLAASSVDRLCLLGEMAPQMAAGASEGGLEEADVFWGMDHGEILTDLQRWLRPGDCVLVKGSRGMRMEKVAEGLRQAFRRSEGKRT